MSNNRIDLESTIWGPHAWFFIDSVCLSYPKVVSDTIKEKYKNFFYSFDTILPCLKCREHYKEYIETYPLNDSILSSKDNLIKWALKLHNIRREDDGKNKFNIDMFYKYYNNMYGLDVRNVNCESKCSLNINRDKLFHNKTYILDKIKLTMYKSLQTFSASLSDDKSKDVNLPLMYCSILKLSVSTTFSCTKTTTGGVA